MRHYGDASSPGSGCSPCAGSRPAGPGCATVDIGTGLLDEARETWFESWSFTILLAAGDRGPRCAGGRLRRPRALRRTGGRPVARGGTVVEADGAGKYLGEFDADGPSGLAAARAVVAEKVREDRLRSCGLEVVRYDVPEMRWRPQDVAARVRDARERGDLGRFTGRLVPSPWSRVPLVHPVSSRCGCPGCSETTASGPQRPSIGCLRATSGRGPAGRGRREGRSGRRRPGERAVSRRRGRGRSRG